jgi:phage FluMu protein gp41
MTASELITYFIEDAEARVEEVLPLSKRIALLVGGVEILQRRLETIETRLSIDIAETLSADDLQAMESQAALLDWVRATRQTAREAIERVSLGEDVDPSSITWPTPPSQL